MAKFSDLELAELQLSPSDWHARRARVILQGRAVNGAISTEAIEKLMNIYKNESNSDFRLRGLWALHVTSSLGENDLLAALEDSDEYIRAWSIQLLGEERIMSSNALQKFYTMAVNDTSAVVRLYLASVSQRIPINDRWEIVSALSQRSDDKNDHNIPKMIWFAMEPNVANDVERGLKLGLETKMPIIAEYIGRRVIDANGMEQLLTAIQKPSANQKYLLNGLRNEIENRSDIKPSDNWEKTYAILSSNESTKGIAIEIAQLFGSADAANQLLTILEDTDASLEDRQKSLTALASRAWSGLKPKMSEFMDDPDLRIQAIRAITHYKDIELGWDMFEKFEKFNEKEKLEILLALSSRRVYANILTEAISEGLIMKSEIPAHIARQLRRVMGNGFVEVWGPIDDISADVESSYKRYKKLLTDKKLELASTIKGKEIFTKTCGACHQLYGEGGILGPELTGSNRSNIDYLLSNILEPSADIQDDYKMVVITTRDGRTYLCTVASDTDRYLVLNILGQSKAKINKSDIQSREDTPNSMMPAGLLDNMDDQEILDLVAYLKS